MNFRNREDAGRKLAKALETYAGREDVIVVALPRGGVVLGRVIADALEAPLDVVVPRKLGAPGHEEYAIGALTESGEAVWNEAERGRFDHVALDAVMEAERAEAKRRLEKYRAGMPPRDLAGKTVIVVDDGIATGFTMRAALRTVRAERPARVVAAVPVAPGDFKASLSNEADETVILSTPLTFVAIGNFYDEFAPVNDERVIALMHPKA
ncbi:MAG TPA: phosphoribosyltransferase family protein [Patescibacteria group bacterium]|nr:phosphoribosyltransferase family protein [Patescibacteria group bacterium]